MKTEAWYCDVCGLGITDPNGGLVTWGQLDGRTKGKFEIVHKGTNCDLHRNKHTLEISTLLGDSGREFLLSFLSYGDMPRRDGVPGLADIDNFVETFRRLQTPGYEEARRYFGLPEVQEAFSGGNEYVAYTPDSIDFIIKTGRKSS